MLRPHGGVPQPLGERVDLVVESGSLDLVVGLRGEKGEDGDDTAKYEERRKTKSKQKRRQENLFFCTMSSSTLLLLLLLILFA